MKTIPVSTSFLVFIFASGCQFNLGEIERLATEKHRMACEMERLKTQTDILWDEMSHYLDQTLPLDMPPPERKNMVNTRNAYLLTAFRVYPTLDTSIQNRIGRVRQKDDALAAQSREVIEQYRKTEQNLNNMLEKSKHGKNLDDLKKIVKKIEALPCHNQ